MNRLIIAGLIILILGSLTSLLVIEEVSGWLQAFITGVIIGSSIALRNQIKKT